MRIRTIKPGFYKDEELAEHEPMVRILFSGLWGLADSEGRLKYRPRYIKAEVLPYDDVDVVKMLDCLHRSGFIQIYEADNARLIQVRNFRKHQRISGKEALIKSEFPPAPPRREATVKHPGSNGEAVVAQERKGKERKGKEGEKKETVAEKSATAHLPVAHPAPTRGNREFVAGFKGLYEKWVGQSFKAEKKHFVIAANLIAEHGYDATVAKTKTLAILCRDRSAWFTKAGWADFSIENLSRLWNSILPTAARDPGGEKVQDFLNELKKQEALRGISGSNPNGQ